MSLDLILFFTFLAVFLLAFGCRRNNVTKDRIQKIQSNHINDDIKSINNKTAEYKNLFKMLTIFLKKFLAIPSKIIVAFNITKKVDRQLIKADIPLKGEEFLSILLISDILLPLLLYSVTASTIKVLLTAAIVLVLPFFMINVAGKKRLKNFDEQIVDALSIISNSVRSGFSFLQAMDMVKREMPSPISTEFGRTLREINLGMSTEEALSNLNSRIESKDMDMAITAILVQRRVGGNLAEVLDNISDTIRERIRIKREIKTLTAQGRISGIIIGLLPFALCLILLVVNPDYILLLFTDPVGIAMLCSVFFMEIIGLLLINKIIKVDY